MLRRTKCKKRERKFRCLYPSAGILAGVMLRLDWAKIVAGLKTRVGNLSVSPFPFHRNFFQAFPILQIFPLFAMSMVQEWQQLPILLWPQMAWACKDTQGKIINTHLRSKPRGRITLPSGPRSTFFLSSFQRVVNHHSNSSAMNKRWIMEITWFAFFCITKM